MVLSFGLVGLIVQVLRVKSKAVASAKQSSAHTSKNSSLVMFILSVLV
jgi:hypothetical protein